MNTERDIFAQEEDRQLTQRCRLPSSLVATLHREFLTLAPTKGRGISLATLQAILRRIAPSQYSEESAVRLFELLDRDGKGVLDFFELMTGILVLCEGSRDRKLYSLFVLYDVDGSGYLETDELLCLARTLVKISGAREGDLGSDSERCTGSFSHYNPMADKPAAGVPDHLRLQEVWLTGEERMDAEQFRRCLLLLDTSGSGRMSFDDFRLGAQTNYAVARCLSQVGVGISRDTPPLDLPRHLTRSCWVNRACAACRRLVRGMLG